MKKKILLAVITITAFVMSALFTSVYAAEISEAQNYIYVTKEFKGLDSANDLNGLNPEFYITIKGGGVDVTLNQTSNYEFTKVTPTLWRWKINVGKDASEFIINEYNYDINGYTKSEFKEKTITIAAANMDFTPYPVTRNNIQDFKFAEDSFIGVAINGGKNSAIIISREPFSVAERKTIEDTYGGGNWKTPFKFYSIKEDANTLRTTGAQIAGKTVYLVDNENCSQYKEAIWNRNDIQGPYIHIQDTSNWTHVSDIVYSYNVNEADVAIVNEYEPVKTSVEGLKIWSDNFNQDGIRPTSIRVELYRDNTPLGIYATANEESQWKYKFNNVNQYYNGELANYSVREVSVTDKDGNVINVANNKVAGYDVTNSGMNVTNTHTPETYDVIMTKTWVDNNNKFNLRPTSLQVQLKKNGANFGDVTTLNSNNCTINNNVWTCKFENLDKYENGSLISYTVEEVVPEKYNVNYDDSHLNITNTLKSTTVSVHKDWNNVGVFGNNLPKVRVQLYANGTKIGDEVILGNNQNWDYTWNYQNTGIYLPLDNSVRYEIKEVGFVDDEGDYLFNNFFIKNTNSNANKTNWTITNTYIGSQELPETGSAGMLIMTLLTTILLGMPTIYLVYTLKK